MWTLAGSYCMAYLTDGFIPAWWVKSQPRGNTLAKRLVAAGLWRFGEKENEAGWWFHDWKNECTKANITADRRASAARQEVARNPQLRAAIRKRDGDFCRYCRTPVEWHNRRGATGGTYDHVIPDGGSTIGNLVVCCRGCNSRKGRRTPEQAGMELLPPPNGPGGGSKSDSIPEFEISRSETRPLHSTPSHTNSLVTSSGGVTSVDAIGPRPQCSKHAENSNENCRGCARRREWDEKNAAALEADQLEQQRRKRAAIADAQRECLHCDDEGWLIDEATGELVEPAMKCQIHLGAVNE